MPSCLFRGSYVEFLTDVENVKYISKLAAGIDWKSSWEEQMKDQVLNK